jgi:hypothetical protein
MRRTQEGGCGLCGCLLAAEVCALERRSMRKAEERAWYSRWRAGAAGQHRTMSCGAMAQPAAAEFLGPMAVWAIRPLMELVGAGCARDAAAGSGGPL